MTEYYELMVPTKSTIYFKVEEGKIEIVAEDNLSFDGSGLAKITKKELDEAIKKIK